MLHRVRIVAHKLYYCSQLSNSGIITILGDLFGKDRDLTEKSPNAVKQKFR